jgi:hypothetical protein
MKWLRWLHLASVGLTAGSMLMLLVLADVVDPVSPISFGAVRQAISAASAQVLIPALLVMLVSGFLLLVARPRLIDARWVWAKAALGVLIAGISFLHVYPMTHRATGYAVQSAAGSVIQAAAPAAAASLAPLDAALAAERRGRWLNLGLVLLATAVAVWRPRLGATSGGSAQTAFSEGKSDEPLGSARPALRVIAGSRSEPSAARVHPLR